MNKRSYTLIGDCQSGIDSLIGVKYSPKGCILDSRKNRLDVSIRSRFPDWWIPEASAVCL